MDSNQQQVIERARMNNIFKAQALMISPHPNPQGAGLPRGSTCIKEKRVKTIMVCPTKAPRKPKKAKKTLADLSPAQLEKMRALVNKEGEMTVEQFLARPKKSKKVKLTKGEEKAIDFYTKRENPWIEFLNFMRR